MIVRLTEPFIPYRYRSNAIKNRYEPAPLRVMLGVNSDYQSRRVNDSHRDPRANI